MEFELKMIGKAIFLTATFCAMIAVAVFFISYVMEVVDNTQVNIEILHRIERV
jgi:hypothetical protein